MIDGNRSLRFLFVVTADVGSPAWGDIEPPIGPSGSPIANRIPVELLPSRTVEGPRPRRRGRTEGLAGRARLSGCQTIRVVALPGVDRTGRWRMPRVPSLAHSRQRRLLPGRSQSRPPPDSRRYTRSADTLLPRDTTASRGNNPAVQD